MLTQRILRGGALLTCAWLLAACGGGGSSSSNPVSVSLPPSLATRSDTNVALMEVRQGPANNVNIPYVTVTVCLAGGVQGSSSCKEIKDVMVDTGSTGLRLFASQINALLPLPDQTVGSSSAVSECANFIATSSWGRIKVADVLIAGERAAAVPIQLMDASDAGAVHCSGAPLLSTVTTPPNNVGTLPANGTVALSANGILGVGMFSNDGQSYFDCTTPGAGCRSITLGRARQVQNPVGLFAVQSSNGVANNNGTVLQLPSLPASGIAAYAPGYLIFGVNTQINNQLGAAHVVPVNAMGRFTTTYRGVALDNSFMDSGSNGLFFPASGTPALATNCAGSNADFFCPAATVALSAGIQLANAVASIDFSIANADQLFNAGSYALGNLGGNMPGNAFDWGLPFFYGRSVYTVLEGTSVNTSTGSLAGPFLAFTN